MKRDLLTEMNLPTIYIVCGNNEDRFMIAGAVSVKKIDNYMVFFGRQCRVTTVFNNNKDYLRDILLNIDDYDISDASGFIYIRGIEILRYADEYGINIQEIKDFFEID